jgi:hypothetical protein
MIPPINDRPNSSAARAFAQAALYTGEMKTDLAGLELKELEDFVVSLGHQKFHAKQI